MTCLLAKPDRLWMICIEFGDSQATRGHFVGSVILPRSMSTRTAWWQTEHLKNATLISIHVGYFHGVCLPSFMSGIMGVVRITSPLTLTSLSMSAGLSSRRLIVLSSPNGRTL